MMTVTIICLSLLCFSLNSTVNDMHGY